MSVGLRPAITDYRGHEVRLFDSYRRLFGDAGLPQEDFIRVRSRIRRGELAGEVVRTSEEPLFTVDESNEKLGFAVNAGITIFFLVMTIQQAGKPGSVLWILAGAVVFSGLFTMLFWRQLRRTFPVKADPKYVASAMLGEGCCPSCACGINGIAPEEDGAVICPGCGAAWSLERDGQFFTMFIQEDDEADE